MVSLYAGTKISVKVDSELSGEVEVRVGCTKGLCCHLFAVVVDVVTQFAREGALHELLYADVFVLMIETIEGLRNKFLKWNEAFENKG